MDKLVFNGMAFLNGFHVELYCTQNRKHASIKKQMYSFHFYYLKGQKTTISNDGATIMKLLDIVHPAAKTLVDISMAQVHKYFLKIVINKK